MTTDAIYEKHGSHWSHQVSAVATTWWLQYDQTLPLAVKGVACETNKSFGGGEVKFVFTSTVKVFFFTGSLGNS